MRSVGHDILRIIVLVLFLLAIVLELCSPSNYSNLVSLLTFVILAITLLLQIRSFQTSKFENKFFELIRMHNANVAEMELGEMHGREVFIAFLKEFKTIHTIVCAKKCFEKDEFKQQVHKQLVLSYSILFIGIQRDSDKRLAINRDKALKRIVGDESIDGLSLSLDLFRNRNGRYGEEKTPTIAELEPESKKYNYVYFDGHQCRLAHYFRNLFHIVAYVDKKGFLCKNEKKDYIKILRAQLSNYEQAILFLNSLTPLGLDWWCKGYIEKYELVKNIPGDFFADHGIDINIESYFKKNYFEYESYDNTFYKFNNGCETGNI